MTTVTILGAKGKFGRAAMTAFVDAGWQVRAFGRNWPDVASGPLAKSVVRYTGDITDERALAQACAGTDVIVHAIHPPYPEWAKTMPIHTAAVIAAAKTAKATVIVPGNVYNYGANAPAILREDTPWQPTTRKGRLRVDMETSFRQSGVRTIVLRSGDFIEAEKSGNWFDKVITAKSLKGRTTYPGPLTAPHAWGYLPDLGRIAVLLAEKRHAFEPFEEFGFGGFGITGQQLVEAVAEATGRAQTMSKLPWGLIRLMGLVHREMREIYEMRYLWQVPHVLEDSKLKQVLPDFEATPLREAMGQVLK